MKNCLARTRLSSGEVWFEAIKRNGKFVLDWKRAARFEISEDGRQVRRRIKKSASKVSLGILKRLTETYAASLRGKESLHATSLEKNGKAIALVGASGAGKSTLAAHLLGNGWGLLTDDALRVFERDGLILARVSSNKLKLSEDILKRSKLKGEYDPNLEKWIVKTKKIRSGAPLNGIFLLERKKRGLLHIQRIRGAKSALILQKNIYNEILRNEKTFANQLRFCAEVAERILIFKLSYPEGLKNLERVRHVLQSFIGN